MSPHVRQSGRLLRRIALSTMLAILFWMNLVAIPPGSNMGVAIDTNDPALLLHDAASWRTRSVLVSVFLSDIRIESAEAIDDQPRRKAPTFSDPDWRVIHIYHTQSDAGWLHAVERDDLYQFWTYDNARHQVPAYALNDPSPEFIADLQRALNHLMQKGTITAREAADIRAVGSTRHSATLYTGILQDLLIPLLGVMLICSLGWIPALLMGGPMVLPARRLRQHYCPACGYDLLDVVPAANATRTCPECGKASHTIPGGFSVEEPAIPYGDHPAQDL